MNDEWAKAQAEIQLAMQADLAAARAEADRLRAAIRDAVRVESALAASEAVTLARVLSILRAALGAMPTEAKGVATLPDAIRLIADRIAANVKYEEDQAVRCNRVLEDEDEFTTWSTVAEARAFLDAILAIDTGVSERT